MLPRLSTLSFEGEGFVRLFLFCFFCGGEPDGGKEQQTRALSLSSGSLQETEKGGGQREMDVQDRWRKVGCINPA